MRASPRQRGEVVVTIDGDLQDDPAEIPRLLAKLDEGFDLVCGWKADRRDPLRRRASLTGLQRRRRQGLRRPPARHELRPQGDAERGRATSCGCTASSIASSPCSRTTAGFRVTEVPVNHRPREHGRSRYGMERYVRGFLDLLTVDVHEPLPPSAAAPLRRRGLAARRRRRLRPRLPHRPQAHRRGDRRATAPARSASCSSWSGIQLLSLGLISELVDERLDRGAPGRPVGRSASSTRCSAERARQPAPRERRSTSAPTTAPTRGTPRSSRACAAPASRWSSAIPPCGDATTGRSGSASWRGSRGPRRGSPAPGSAGRRTSSSSATPGTSTSPRRGASPGGDRSSSTRSSRSTTRSSATGAVPRRVAGGAMVLRQIDRIAFRRSDLVVADTVGARALLPRDVRADARRRVEVALVGAEDRALPPGLAAARAVPWRSSSGS